jgi:hypothetical protein
MLGYTSRVPTHPELLLRPERCCLLHQPCLPAAAAAAAAAVDEEQFNRVITSVRELRGRLYLWL